MFDSARLILDRYVDTAKMSRFTFYSVETERGENPEDVYYLCSVRGHYYVVFETDYIMSTLASVAQEAADIFERYGLAPMQWIVKKDSQALVGAQIVPIGAPNVDALRESLVSDRVGSAFGYEVRYAVIECTAVKEYRQSRFHPSAYGRVL